MGQCSCGLFLYTCTLFFCSIVSLRNVGSNFRRMPTKALANVPPVSRGAPGMPYTRTYPSMAYPGVSWSRVRYKPTTTWLYRDLRSSRRKLWGFLFRSILVVLFPGAGPKSQLPPAAPSARPVRAGIGCFPRRQGGPNRSTNKSPELSPTVATG